VAGKEADPSPSPYVAATCTGKDSLFLYGKPSAHHSSPRIYPGKLNPDSQRKLFICMFNKTEGRVAGSTTSQAAEKGTEVSKQSTIWTSGA
jgi:hypothetical protein